MTLRSFRVWTSSMIPMALINTSLQRDGRTRDCQINCFNSFSREMARSPGFARRPAVPNSNFEFVSNFELRISNFLRTVPLAR
jgi:hypothetical protein